MIKFSIISFVFIVCIFFFSKNGYRASSVVSDSTMEDILFDLYKTEAAIQIDSLHQQALLASILKKYHVSYKAFDISLNWYNENLDHFYKVINHLIIRLNSIEDFLIQFRREKESSKKILRKKFFNSHV